MMIIAMSCTKNWYKYLMVDLYALLSTNKVKKIYLFLETDKIYNINRLRKEFNVEIEIINYNKEFNKYMRLKDNYEVCFTKAALIRLFMSKIIKEEKIIYLDTDAIVLQDISELWKMDINNYYVAGVKDTGLLNSIDYLDEFDLPEEYINSGVMIMNLDKIRKDGIDELFIKEINKKKYRYPDQDVINKVCRDKILFINNEYNSSTSTEFADNIKIMHYTNKKDKNWLDKHYNKELWYDWKEKYKIFINDNKNRNKEYEQLDIIIPLYNRRDYIERALKSIVIQTIREYITVILVDDGSEEKYDDILEKYQDKLNIKFIKLKKNKGPGFARNIGIKNATSRYILFVDSDDEYSSKYAVEILYNEIKDTNYKIIAAKVNANGIIKHGFANLYSKIYDREYIIKNKIYFKDYFASEDLYFNYLYMLHLKKDEYKEIDMDLYNYYYGTQNSIFVKENDYIKRFITEIKCFNNAYKKCKKYNSYYIITLIKEIFKYHSLYYCENKNKYLKNKNDLNKYLIFYAKFYKRYKKYIDKLLLKLNEDEQYIKDFINLVKKW